MSTQPPNLRKIPTADLEHELQIRRIEEEERRHLRAILEFCGDKSLVIRFDMTVPKNGDSFGATRGDVRKILIDGIRTAVEARLVDLDR